MSETTSSAQRPTSAAGSEKDERLRLLFVAGGIVVTLALAVLLLRLQRLSELPPRLFYDEGAHGVDALRVLQGEHAVFFPENNGREGLIVYAVALSTSLLGHTVLAIRLPTALASAGTVIVVFWLGRLLFGKEEENGKATPWRGLLVGGVGAGLLAVSLGQTVIGRTAFRANFLPLLLSLCFALLWWGWRQRCWWRIVLAGACAGLLPYTYIAARSTPFLFLFFGLSFLLPWGRSEDGGERSERGFRSLRFSPLTSRLRAELPWAGIFVGVAVLLAAPILIYFVLHPENFFLRSNQLSVIQTGRSQGGPLWAIVVNVWEHLLAFGIRGDPSGRHNYSGQPMLNSWEALFFWLGVGMAVWRWQRPAYRLLLLWLGLLLLPAMLSKDQNVPNTLRMIGAAPAIYLLIGVGVCGAFRFRPLILFIHVMGKMTRLENLKSPIKSITKITQIKVENESRAVIAMGLVVSGLILVQGVLTHRTYFEKWAAAATEIEQLYWTQWRELTRVVSVQPSADDIAYLIPSYKWHYSFEYLDQSAAPANVVFLGASNLTQNVRSTLVAMEKVSAVKVVDWNDDGYFQWSHYETERFVVLLGKYGRYLGSDEYGSFQIHTYTDINLDRPWKFYEHLEPLTVHYDGGISLHGLALGQGEEQLSSQQQFNLEQNRSLWVGLQWQTAPGLDIDYSISLRLLNAEGASVYQTDKVLWDEIAAATSLWQPEEPVDTIFYLEIPADLPPGEYELRLVVYDFKTLKPTVELGVWEPEAVLARLQLADVDN